mgnify:CR=1 FL=1
MSDSPEFIKPDTEVINTELQTRLGNLEVENEKLQSEYSRLLASSHIVTEKLREEVREVRSQLATECADREEVKKELSDLKQKSATAGKLPDAGDLLNRLKANYEEMIANGKKPKKPTASVADIEGILEILEES